MKERLTPEATLPIRRTDSTVYQIVPGEDGGYSIACNGRVLPVFSWREDQLPQCVRMLDALAGQPGSER